MNESIIDKLKKENNHLREIIDSYKKLADDMQIAINNLKSNTNLLRKF